MSLKLHQRHNMLISLDASSLVATSTT